MTDLNTLDHRPSDFGHRTVRRRWPLLAIGASAGTATWSGWVGLGQLTGFGVVHPLPGIADGFTINTAVTLPIGVEAYAMYALSIATSSRPLASQTRRYAWLSSAAALVLGMAGQVAFHVMTAHRSARVATTSPAGLAPWWVIALVSCLPVLVLGAASLLWHLAGSPDADPDRSVTGSDPASSAVPDPVQNQSGNEVPATDPVLTTHARPEPMPEEGDRRPGIAARPADLARVRSAITAGDLPAKPTASAIRTLLAISPAYARAARDALTATSHRPEVPSAETPAPEPEHVSSTPPAPQQQSHPAAEEAPENSFQQHIPAVTKKAEPPTQPITTEEPIQKEQERHTYAVGLP